MVAERGGHAGSQGAGAGRPGCGLCSQARPEINGGVPQVPRVGLPAAPGPCSLGQLHREPGPLSLAKGQLLDAETHPPGSRPCTGSRSGAPRPSTPLAFLLPRKCIFKRRGHLRWDPQPPGRSNHRSPKLQESRRDGESRLHGKQRAEKPSGLSRPPGGEQCHRQVEPPPGRSGKVGEAASEKAPGSEKGPDRTPASGRATAGLAARPADLREAPHGASGEGEATRTVGDRHCFLHWLRLGPCFLPSQSPASF